MKTYLSDQQIRLVGRVWEIRRYLKMAQQRITTDVSLLAFLAAQTGHAGHSSKGLMLDGETTYAPPSDSRPSQPPHQSPRSTQGPGLVPFPSKK